MPHLFGHHDGLRRWEGAWRLKRDYKRLYHKDLECLAPAKFSEKLFNRMLAQNVSPNPLFTRLADKRLARDYVREKVGEACLVKLLWQGVDPREIPFDSLPSRCVIKTNHGSGGNIIVNGPVDKKAVIKKLDLWLSENFYWEQRENHYRAIPPYILVEEFIEDGAIAGPLDYRFFCFDGVPAVIQVDNHAHDINPFYDASWNKLDLSYRKSFKDVSIEKPKNFDQMLAVASALSEGFDFVRVDLYNVNGQPVFGEMTFTPGAGRFTFNAPAWDVALGEKWVGFKKG